MFLAKYIDQKQGEARVSSLQNKRRQHLETWLTQRPSVEEVETRGILGRGIRFEQARDVCDQLLRSRLQSSDERLFQIPPGTFQYSSTLGNLLDGGFFGAADDELEDPPRPKVGPTSESLKSLAAALEQKAGELREQLCQSEAEWARASEATLKAGSGDTLESSRLTEASENLAKAVSLLEKHRVQSKESLAGVFEELRGYQMLVAKQQCLEATVAIAERTERSRVYLCRGAAGVQLEDLEAIPQLCERLPAAAVAAAAGAGAGAGALAIHWQTQGAILHRVSGLPKGGCHASSTCSCN
mmetsp:Transcript_33493/g.72469  ORF Transcript_33493/g.72469 Transcript_33493/m.72469 type:complete len:299 (+) Transcript_33493:64-960(+)